jgi:hypothetical protein
MIVTLAFVAAKVAELFGSLLVLFGIIINREDAKHFVFAGLLLGGTGAVIAWLVADTALVITAVATLLFCVVSGLVMKLVFYMSDYDPRKKQVVWGFFAFGVVYTVGLWFLVERFVPDVG